MTRILMLTLLLTNCVATADPLFESDEPLSVTITGPFSAITTSTNKDETWAGTLTHEGVDYEINLSLRGNSRLIKNTCRYPPLRIDFKKKQIKDTLFEKQNDIKLVVQCNARNDYADYLRAEYLLYRAFNLLTPVSYRVRWANVRYVDDSYVVNQPAFFIERKTRLAKRVGLETSGLKGIHSSELAPDAAALVTLWQFMIGNPDYSIIRGDEECCHNAKLLVSDDGHYVPIIYDFDGTGLVGAEYARPPVRVPIKDVSERVYLGFCRHNDHLIQVRKLLLERREGIHALFSDDPMLGARARSEAVRYLKKSYQFLGRDGSFKRQVLDACRS